LPFDTTRRHIETPGAPGLARIAEP